MAFVLTPGNPVPAGAEELWFEGRGGLKIRALYAPAQQRPPRGSVIICDGRTEFIEKYFEFIAELQGRGFCVFMLDWRGQGLSDRELPNRLKGHMTSLDDAVSDLAAGLKLVADRLPRPHLMVAHSMGGAIGLRALQTRRVDVEAALFSAPMWGIKGVKPWQRRLAAFVTTVGLGSLFAGPPRTWRKEPFNKNPVTHSRERHMRNQALVMAEPDLALAAPTFGWVNASCNAIEGFHQPSALAHLRIPITVLSAGEEALVSNASHEEIAKALPQATHLEIAGAKHELIQETDDKRAHVLAAFDTLAAAVAPQRASA